ncbi:NACHT domain-containing protein [Fusarium sp. LHS14.1]|nr:NACHT domain-containing protein [Fusarium sp. LHS14.1]
MLHIASSFYSILHVLEGSNNIAISHDQMVNVIDPFSKESEMPDGRAANQSVMISENERYLAYFTRDNTLPEPSVLPPASFRRYDYVPCQSLPPLLAPGPIPRHEYQIEERWVLRDSEKHIWLPSRYDYVPCQYLPHLLEPGPIPRHKYQIGERWIHRDSEKHIWVPSRYRPLDQWCKDVQGSTLAVRWGSSNVYHLRFSNDPEDSQY